MNQKHRHVHGINIRRGFILMHFLLQKHHKDWQDWWRWRIYETIAIFFIHPLHFITLICFLSGFNFLLVNFENYFIETNRKMGNASICKKTSTKPLIVKTLLKIRLHILPMFPNWIDLRVFIHLSSEGVHETEDAQYATKLL